MGDKKKAILLRISPDLWEGLSRWARDDLRSLNAQIEYVLRDAARKRGHVRAAEPGNREQGDGEAANPDDDRA